MHEIENSDAPAQIEAGADTGRTVSPSAQQQLAEIARGLNDLADQARRLTDTPLQGQRDLTHA
jgi:hypothetical protein